MQLHACKVRGLLSYYISLGYYSGIRVGDLASLRGIQSGFYIQFWVQSLAWVKFCEVAKFIVGQIMLRTKMSSSIEAEVMGQVELMKSKSS